MLSIHSLTIARKYLPTWRVDAFDYHVVYVACGSTSFLQAPPLLEIGSYQRTKVNPERIAGILMLKKIYLKFTNGLTFATGVREILSPLIDEYDFVENQSPDFVIFGPYGNAIPPAGGPVRIGYFCENMYPDMSICDWAFGVPYEEDVGHPRYMRIQWHGLAPSDLIKRCVDSPDQLIENKTRFCNFLYSNRVPYRERFFRELSKYKHIDAPGFSMNNMANIDAYYNDDRSLKKRRFLEQYKFTIAFENYSYPGYHTEKILDPMLAGSLPIYFGNPNIDKHFNSRSFVNAHEYVRGRCMPLAKVLEHWAQPSFTGTPNPSDVPGRLLRRMKGEGRKAKMCLECWDYGALIEHIVRMDQDNDLYLSYVAQPWFVGNLPPSNEETLSRWRQIFEGAGCSQ